MAPLDVIGEPGNGPSLRLSREAIFFISQRVIILGNSDVRSFHKGEKMKDSSCRDFNVGGSNERTICTRSFSLDWKNSCEPSNRVCPRVANIVRDVSRVSWIVFRSFFLRARRTVISTAESSWYSAVTRRRDTFAFPSHFVPVSDLINLLMSFSFSVLRFLASRFYFLSSFGSRCMYRNWYDSSFLFSKFFAWQVLFELF